MRGAAMACIAGAGAKGRTATDVVRDVRARSARLANVSEAAVRAAIAGLLGDILVYERGGALHAL